MTHTLRCQEVVIAGSCCQHAVSSVAAVHSQWIMGAGLPGGFNKNTKNNPMQSSRLLADQCVTRVPECGLTRRPKQRHDVIIEELALCSFGIPVRPRRRPY